MRPQGARGGWASSGPARSVPATAISGLQRRQARSQRSACLSPWVSSRDKLLDRRFAVNGKVNGSKAVGEGTSVEWPAGFGGPGNDGVDRLHPLVTGKRKAASRDAELRSL